MRYEFLFRGAGRLGTMPKNRTHGNILLEAVSSLARLLSSIVIQQSSLRVECRTFSRRSA